LEEKRPVPLDNYASVLHTQRESVTSGLLQPSRLEWSIQSVHRLWKYLTRPVEFLQSMPDFEGGYAAVGAALGILFGLMLGGPFGVVLGALIGGGIGWYIERSADE
jgi:hypothetical protein